MAVCWYRAVGASLVVIGVQVLVLGLYFAPVVGGGIVFRATVKCATGAVLSAPNNHFSAGPDSCLP